MASNWVDNGSGWLAIMLRSREEVLALRPNYSTLTGLKVGVFAAFNPLKDGNSAQFSNTAMAALWSTFDEYVLLTPRGWRKPAAPWITSRGNGVHALADLKKAVEE